MSATEKMTQELCVECESRVISGGTSTPALCAPCRADRSDGWTRGYRAGWRKREAAATIGPSAAVVAACFAAVATWVGCYLGWLL